MVVLIVMAGFFPGKKYGGPPVSVDNFCSLMCNEHEIYIVTRNHDMDETTMYKNINNGWNNRGNCKVLYVSDDEYIFRTFKSVVKEIKPDILFLQDLFQTSVIPCLIISRIFNIECIIPPRGELCENAISRGKVKKLFYIFVLRLSGLISNVKFQATSKDEVQGINRYLGVGDDRIYLIPNVPSVPAKDYKQPIKEIGSLKIVYFARIHPIKNLLFAIDCLNNIEGKIVFDIYGSLEDEEYWKKCTQAINNTPNNIQTEYKGLLLHDDVYETISNYHCMFLPTFGENYGQSIAESLSIGCPIIISDKTPWNDINGTDAGFALSLDNKAGFIDALNAFVDMDNDKMQYVYRKTKEYFNNKSNVEVIRDKYNELLDNKKEK